MAKGKKCPKCNTYMYAQHEDKMMDGSYRIGYICTNNDCKHGETVFER